MEKLSREFFDFDESTLANVFSRLGDELGVVDAKPESRFLRVYYDTFDWRLYRAGFTLAVEAKPSPGRSELRKLGSGQLILQAPRMVGRFAWENHPGPLRDFLTEHIGIRGLLPQVESRGRAQSYSVRDKRGKVVLGMAKEEAVAVSLNGDVEHELKPRFRLEGVRGYEKALQQALAVFENGRIPRAPGDIFDEALVVVGLSVGKYQSKPDIPLDPKMPTIAAMSAILLHLRQVMDMNLQGTALNLDTEFLHDFRVAVRRTRCALGQIKGIFPETTLKPFLEGFKWLGNITGPTRDMDVYLLKLPEYCRNLPERIRPDLEPLRDFLQRHQLREQKILAGQLKSSRLRKLLDDWGEYLEFCPDFENLPPAAFIPIGEIANKKILKTYRKFIREGREIGDYSSVVTLHRLRIIGKKLRYLLEFFQTLYPPKPMSRLVKEMKLMQDFLGDFQDLTVQQQHLSAFGEAMKLEKDIPGATLLAMGRLMEDMERRQQAMRLKFNGCFTAFAWGDADRLFKKLLAFSEENLE